jgi:hypothetical protein
MYSTLRSGGCRRELREIGEAEGRKQAREVTGLKEEMGFVVSTTENRHCGIW